LLLVMPSLFGTPLLILPLFTSPYKLSEQHQQQRMCKATVG